MGWGGRRWGRRKWGGRRRFVDPGLVMAEGSYNYSAGGKRDILKYFEAAVDPGVEVGLYAAFEF